MSVNAFVPPDDDCTAEVFAFGLRVVVLEVGCRDEGCE